MSGGSGSIAPGRGRREDIPQRDSEEILREEESFLFQKGFLREEIFLFAKK